MASKKMGRASIAVAFMRSKVTNSQWWSWSTGITVLAYLISCGVPMHSFSSRSSWSIESSPTVRPLIKPAKRVKKAAIPTHDQNFEVPKGSFDSTPPWKETGSFIC